MTRDGLSEDAAHRLIARAIELDARRAEEISIAQLREVAEEAGISARAFEEALEEVSTPKPSIRDRFRKWMRRDQGVSPTRSILDSVFANVVAFGAFWATGFIFGRVGDSMTTMWYGQSGGILAANLLGVAIASRMNARVTTLILSVTAIAQTAEFVLHLIYGIQSVQGGPTHFAVVLASLLGIAASGLVARQRVARAAEQVESDPRAQNHAPEVTERVRATLRLRPA